MAAITSSQKQPQNLFNADLLIWYAEKGKCMGGARKSCMEV